MATSKKKSATAAAGEGEPCDQIKDFFGVYLLVSHSAEAKFNGKTYIGYTVNPNRRIVQHNRGSQQGGAKRTSNRGPWKMVLIVHGFPNNITALRFEWAWQQPKVSRRLKAMTGLQKKRVKETHFQHKFRILTEMLRVGPWDRLPLQIRWLCAEYCTDFPPLKPPPKHMIICFGRVVTKKKQRANESENVISTLDRCLLCKIEIESDDGLSCLNSSSSGCTMKAHSVCLAKEFLRVAGDEESIIPIAGDCPRCFTRMLWGDLIRRFNGSLDLVEEDSATTGDLHSDVEVSDVSSIDGEA